MLAQGRYRCLIWGAAHGEQLPAFPEPTHRVMHFNTGAAQAAKVGAALFTSCVRL
jgi:hypothetical protein